MHPLLARDEHAFPAPTSLPKYVVVTGAHGSIGLPLCAALKRRGATVVPVDLPRCDIVKSPIAIRDLIWSHSPCVVLHLAADKHAPRGELYPFETSEVNVIGTQNVVRATLDVDAKVIFASTCKAADPETAYGASKLIAERIVLNAGGVVGRLYNTIPSAGNVVEIWNDQRAKGKSLTYVHDARRFFISRGEAIQFLLSLVDCKPGRYAPDPGPSIWLEDLVKRFARPGEKIKEIAPRRGDRLVEPMCAASETMSKFGTRYTIQSPHDADVAERVVVPA